jgi:hypothetical protein
MASMSVPRFPVPSAVIVQPLAAGTGLLITVDCGITGLDIVRESGVNVVELLRLGFEPLLGVGPEFLSLLQLTTASIATARRTRPINLVITTLSCATVKEFRSALDNSRRGQTAEMQT